MSRTRFVGHHSVTAHTERPTIGPRVGRRSLPGHRIRVAARPKPGTCQPVAFDVVAVAGAGLPIGTARPDDARELGEASCDWSAREARNMLRRCASTAEVPRPDTGGCGGPMGRSPLQGSEHGAKNEVVRFARQPCRATGGRYEWLLKHTAHLKNVQPSA